MVESYELTFETHEHDLEAGVTYLSLIFANSRSGVIGSVTGLALSNVANIFIIMIPNHLCLLPA
jgi:hypothetical protein